MSRVTITIHVDLPEGAVPSVDYADDVPPEPAYIAAPPLPEYDPDARVPSAVPVASTVPSCPVHGPMTFHQTKKDGTPMPRYSCDARMPDGSWCKTKMQLVK